MTHSKSAHAGVRFYSTVSCMAGAPTPIHGYAFPMGTPVTPPCRITPITNMGIRESEAFNPYLQLSCRLALCGWFKKEMCSLPLRYSFLSSLSFSSLDFQKGRLTTV